MGSTTQAQGRKDHKMTHKVLAVLLGISAYSVSGYPYYYLHQFTGEHFQERPQPPVYPQQYQAQPWNQIVQPEYQLHPEYPQFPQPRADYPPGYFDQFQQPPQFYQGYGNPQFIHQYDSLPVGQYGPQYDPPPQIEVLPKYPTQYDSVPQYNHQVENLPGYPPNQYPPNYGDLPYHLDAPVQYPQYPIIQEKIPEVGSSYVRPGAWSGPVKYYIDDRGKLSPPMDPMGNIIYSGQPGTNLHYGTGGVGWPEINQNYGTHSGGWPVANTNINNNAADVIDEGGYLQPADTNINGSGHEGDVTDADVPHQIEEEIYVDECDQLSCYNHCRISLQGGGGCSNSLCKCYPKDGIRRPEDNIWFELSEADQKKILDVENRFEAVPAVMTTNIVDDTPKQSAQPTSPTQQTIRSTATELTTTLKPTEAVEDFHTSKTTQGDVFSFDDATTEDIFIDTVESGEKPVDDYDDSTAWDDGSGAFDDEDNETDSWWG